MKLLKNLSIIVLAMLAIACSNDKPNSRNVELGPAPTPIDANALTNQPATAVGAVQHYICPNNCANSGGPTQGTCPTCGNAYVHNAAYHTQQNQTSTPATQQAAAASTAPGLYHYTCPNGCTGGAGMATACATCGTMLTHNAAFHAAQNNTTTTTTATPQNKSPLFIDNN